MSTPTIVAQRWLSSRLAGDTLLVSLLPGGISLDDVQAPQPAGTLYPRGRVSLVNPSDLLGVGAAIIWTQLDYDITAIARGQSYEAIASAAARIHTLLHDQAGSVTGGAVRGCYRLQPIAYPELTTGGIQFRHLGGTYRLYVQVT